MIFWWERYNNKIYGFAFVFTHLVKMQDCINMLISESVAVERLSKKKKKIWSTYFFRETKMLKPEKKAVVGCGTYLNMHSNIIISHQWKNVIFCKDSSTFLLSPLNLSINFYLCEKSSAGNWNTASVGIKFIEIFHIFVTLFIGTRFL